jgi:hypothetical protein
VAQLVVVVVVDREATQPHLRVLGNVYMGSRLYKTVRVETVCTHVVEADLAVAAELLDRVVKCGGSRLFRHDRRGHRVHGERL